MLNYKNDNKYQNLRQYKKFMTYGRSWLGAFHWLVMLRICLPIAQLTSPYNETQNFQLFPRNFNFALVNCWKNFNDILQLKIQI